MSATTKDNSLFITAFPELAKDVAAKHGGLDWINKYSDVQMDGTINHAWERNKNGVLVDVTAREKAKQEVLRAREALEKAEVNVNA